MNGQYFNRGVVDSAAEMATRGDGLRHDGAFAPPSCCTIEPDFADLTYGSGADAGRAYGTAASPRLAYVSHCGSVPDRVRAAAEALNIRVQPMSSTTFRAEMASAEHLIREIVWLDLCDSNGADSDLLDLAQSAVATDSSALILTTTLAQLDRCWSVLGDEPACLMLVDPDDNACLAGLAGALAKRRNVLHDDVAQHRDVQLERLQMEVERIAQLLARLNLDGLGNGPRTPSYDASAANAGTARVESGVDAHGYRTDVPAYYGAREIRQMIRQRRLREEFFPADMFADPAWDMMLDLYASRLEGTRVSVSSLCIAAAVPATTALRWIRTLTETGLFLREADPMDGRRIFVILSEETADALYNYFARLAED